MAPVLSDERRQALYAAKLRALVRDHFGATVEPSTHPGGAMAGVDGIGWVLLETAPERGLGSALAWSMANDVEELHVLASSGTGVLARRAGRFAIPPRIWRIVDADLIPAEVAAPADLRPALPDPELTPFVELIESAGADPVVEHGVLTGEVYGLEVARAVPGPAGWELQVGVGRHDRDAFVLMHGEVPTVEALRRVVAMAVEHRRPGAPPHALNRLARSKLLRARLLADPGLVDAERLEPVAPPFPADSVKDDMPAAAAGVETGGGPVVVVASAGVDLDLVPTAADVRLAVDPRAAVVLAIPHRDRLPIVERLASALEPPARIVALPDPIA